MSNFKIHKTENYTIISNHHLKNKELSLKAKGLLSIMLSLPKEWDYSINGLVAICKENHSAIVSTLNELKNHGYLEVKKFLPNETKSGRIEYEYHIYENPNKLKQEGEKQAIENQCIEFQYLENQTQYNINNINNNNLKNKDNIKKENIKEKYFDDPELNKTFIEYLELRKKLKAVNTERAIKMLINELNKYDDETKLLMIEQSIINSWKSVYPLKNKPKANETQYDNKQWEHDII